MGQVAYMLLRERKINILHVIDLSKTGGVETMFMDFLRQITVSNSNLDHAVFVLRIDSNRESELLKHGVKAYLPKNNKYNIFRRLLLIKIIAENRYDIVHGQNFSGNFWAAIGVFFQIKKRVKLITHEHGSSWMVKGLQRALSKFWANQSALVICNSSAASTIIREKICRNSNLKIIYNGIKPKNLVTLCDEPNDEFRILFVGRLEEVKGIRELVSALRILLDQNVKFKCDILGDGRLKNWLQVYLESNDLADFVKMHGVVSNVDVFMARSDVLVLPSLREPLGNVILEAASQLLPVVASKIDGIVEIVEDGKTGILLEPRFISRRSRLPEKVVNEYGKLINPMAIDPVELAHTLINLKCNPTECLNYGIAANQFLERFTIEHYTKEIHDVYLGV